MIVYLLHIFHPFNISGLALKEKRNTNTHAQPHTQTIPVWFDCIVCTCAVFRGRFDMLLKPLLRFSRFVFSLLTVRPNNVNLLNKLHLFNMYISCQQPNVQLVALRNQRVERYLFTTCYWLRSVCLFEKKMDASKCFANALKIQGWFSNFRKCWNENCVKWMYSGNLVNFFPKGAELIW